MQIRPATREKLEKMGRPAQILSLPRLESAQEGQEFPEVVIYAHDRKCMPRLLDMLRTKGIPCIDSARTAEEERQMEKIVAEERAHAFLGSENALAKKVVMRHCSPALLEDIINHPDVVSIDITAPAVDVARRAGKSRA